MASGMKDENCLQGTNAVKELVLEKEKLPFWLSVKKAPVFRGSEELWPWFSVGSRGGCGRMRGLQG